jgi:hypothetical protein
MSTLPVICGTYSSFGVRNIRLWYGESRAFSKQWEAAQGRLSVAEGSSGGTVAMAAYLLTCTRPLMICLYSFLVYSFLLPPLLPLFAAKHYRFIFDSTRAWCGRLSSTLISVMWWWLFHFCFVISSLYVEVSHASCYKLLVSILSALRFHRYIPQKP